MGFWCRVVWGNEVRLQSVATLFTVKNRMEAEIKELADSIYRRKVMRARELSVSERLETGIELFEGAVGMMKDGIRAQFPDLNEEEVTEMVKRRLDRMRQVQEHGIYRQSVN